MTEISKSRARHSVGEAVCTLQDGPAPLVVLVHGWTCRAADWAGQLPALTGRHAWMTIDLPGHGEAPPPDSALTIEALASVLTQACRESGFDDFVLVGHSMGGTIAMEAARELGDAVRGVLLADTFLIDYGRLDENAVQSSWQPFARDFRRAMDGLVDNCAGTLTTDEIRARLKRDMSAMDPAVALPLWDSLLRWNPDAAMREASAPIHAINCPLVADATRQRLAPRITDEVLPGTGHFLMLDDPQGFNRAILAWLDSLG